MPRSRSAHTTDHRAALRKPSRYRRRRSADRGRRRVPPASQLPYADDIASFERPRHGEGGARTRPDACRTLHLCTGDGAEVGRITHAEYLVAVAMLEAMRHDQLWLKAQTLHQILVLEDPRAFNLFEAAVQCMGGRNADMPSHIGVSIDMMRGAWTLKLPPRQRGRAVGRLLEQLVLSRPDDWKAVLHVIDFELAKYARTGAHLPSRARDYLGLDHRTFL